MQKVKGLIKGSRLGVVAPASDVSEEAVRKGAAELMDLEALAGWSECGCDHRTAEGDFRTLHSSTRSSLGP